jgi:NADPH:quinone reductase-like Zn-dependent oxidoreductase
MKAMVCTKYGSPDVLQLKEVEKPMPGKNEILVKVQATSINAADWHLLTADIFLVRLNMGLLKPKHTILGCDIAGTVEAVGRDVRQFKPGDAVFGDVFGHNFGEFAEYHPIADYQRALASKGQYVMIGGSLAQLFEVMFQGPRMSKKVGRQMSALTLKPNPVVITVAQEHELL